MTGRRRTTRREFIKAGAASLAGAALAGGCALPGPEEAAPDGGSGAGRIVRRTLGRTGLQLPVVSMGSCYAINLVRAALDRGVVYIHTSSGYGERKCPLCFLPKKNWRGNLGFSY